MSRQLVRSVRSRAASYVGARIGDWKPGIIAVPLLILCAGAVRADRTILSPRGLVMSPGALQLEYAGMPADGHTNYQWLTLGIPGKDLGLEIEGERLYAGGRARWTGSAQYSFTGNAFSDIAPAISAGVRDVANQGREGRAVFAALSKTIGLSEAQERVIRGLRIHVGYGTSRMDGAFASVELRLRPGFTIAGEYLSRRFNAELVIPVGDHLSLRAYSLNGAAFYGASISVRR